MFMPRFPKKIQSWDSLALLFLVTLPFFYFWRVTIGSQAFSGGDLYNFFLPIRFELARALAVGRLPLWTPNLDSGFPLFAEGQVGALYPLNTLFLRFFPLPFALSYTVLAHIAWALIGMYLFCRSSRVQVGGSLLAAFSFGFSGFFLAHIPHPAMSTVAAWLPWLLYFQNKFWQNASVQSSSGLVWLFLISLSMGLEWLAGSPQLALYNGCVFAIFGILGARFWHRSVSEIYAHNLAQRIRALAKVVVLTLLPILAGGAIGAVQLLPTSELLSLSIRAKETNAQFFANLAIDSGTLSQFIFPLSVLVDKEPSLYDQELWYYFGVAPLLLACLAPRLRWDARTVIFFVFGLLAVSLALGEATPFYQLLSTLPLINRFRVPARFLFYAVFAETYLAGVGYDELQTRLAPKKSTIITWGLGIGSLALAIVEIAEKDLQPISFWIGLWNWLPWVLLASSIISILAAFRGHISRLSFGMLILGLTFLDLTTYGFLFSSEYGASSSVADLVEIPRAVSFVQPHSLDRVFTHSENPRISPDRLAIFNIQSPQIYSPLSIQRNEEYQSNPSPAMLNLANVRYYLPPLKTKEGNYPEPAASLIFQPLENKIDLPEIQTARVELVTFTDQSENLPDGFLVGDLLLRTSADNEIILPIRLGSETADWALQAYAPINRIAHHRPANTVSFLASLLPVAKEFQGLKYIAQYDLSAAMQIKQISARSYLPPGRLTIERISLIDPGEHLTSLAELTHYIDFATVFKSQALEVFQNLNVLPRAFIVHQAAIVADNRVLDQMHGPNFQPDRLVLLSDGEPLEVIDDRDQASDMVMFDNYESERVALSVKTDRVGYLVLADTWYPGWQVFVDGQRSEIHRADYIFRAVLIQPGTHSLVFEYHPEPFYYGAIISGVTLIVSAAATIIIYASHRESQ